MEYLVQARYCLGEDFSAMYGTYMSTFSRYLGTIESLPDLIPSDFIEWHPIFPLAVYSYFLSPDFYLAFLPVGIVKKKKNP